MTSVRWAAWLPWVSLAALTALWAARWAAFPLVLDPSYHLVIARQVADPAALARHPLRPVADGELAAVFRNPTASVGARPPQAILPLWAALGLAGIAGALIVWDTARPRRSIMGAV